MEIASAIDKPFELLAAFDRIDHPPRGRDGGTNGAAGEVRLKSGKKLKGKGFQVIPAGDRLVVLTSGGAGIGAPKSRSRETVAADVADGLVTAAQAAKVYGAGKSDKAKGKGSRKRA
jgi:N-methylhydantoinase B